MRIANPKTVTTDFQSVRTFAVPPEAVVAALTTPGGVSAWWGPTIGSLAEGDTFEVGFGSSRRIVIVAAWVGPRHIEWKVKEAPHTPEWVGTTIVFDLAPADEGAELRFRHDGLTPRLECFDMCHEGWTHYLASLVAYVDTGEGHPYRAE